MVDEPLVVEFGVYKADACVIWLHGLGADGYDFEPIVPELQLDPGLNVRFLFPHAPMIPVTINQGFVMRAWFDISAADIAIDQDEDGIRQSAQRIRRIIDEQIADGIEAKRIVLAGFSQGGAIALQVALRGAQALGGVIGLSTYLPLEESLAKERSAANAGVPIFLAHGSIDPVIPIDHAYRCRNLLESEGYHLDWHEYNGMAHSVSEREISEIAQWLENTLC